MSNEAASRGRPEEYTELSKLRPKKKVSVFAYVHKAVTAFNKDPQGQPQVELRLWLTDSKTQQPVPFSLFRDKDDDAFRGELREGILVRVHRAKCRESDGGMWLFGKAGVAGMHVVGFDLKDVLNVVYTTSPTFFFTQQHHDKLTELQHHFLQRDNGTDSMSCAFAFRSRLAARLVQDQTYAPSVTYTVKLLDEPLTRGHSSPPVVIKVKDDEPESKENAAAVKPPKRKPDVITLDDDEEESEESAAAVDIKPSRLALNAMDYQVAARRSNTQFTEPVHDWQNPSAAASWRTQSPPLKRSSMKRSNFAQSGPAFSRFPEAVHDRQMPSATAPSPTLSPPPKRPSRERSCSTQSVPAFRQPEEVVHNTQMPPAGASSQTPSPPPKRPFKARSSFAQSGPLRMAAASSPCQTLRSAQARSYFDCICEVIGVLDNGDYTILRVWDGTMPPKSLARCQYATPITLDSELEASVHDYVVDICCYDEHAISAKAMEPRDKVSIVNVHYYVRKSGVEAYTLHKGPNRGREIRLLKSPHLIERLESQLNAVRPSVQSQGLSDDEESFAN